jgi:hypothetical protein
MSNIIERQKLRQMIMTHMTYQDKLEDFIKAFAEENDKNEEAYNNLTTKSFTRYNAVIHFIKTEKKFRNACKELYDFILHARKTNACPNDIFAIKKNKLYIDNSN